MLQGFDISNKKRGNRSIELLKHPLEILTFYALDRYDT